MLWIIGAQSNTNRGGGAFEVSEGSRIVPGGGRPAPGAGAAWETSVVGWQMWIG